MLSAAFPFKTGNILLGFASAPKWIGILGNITVLIHMIPAYQVCALFRPPCVLQEQRAAASRHWRSRDISEGAREQLNESKQPSQPPLAARFFVQVFAQPVYATFEDKLLLCFPSLVHVREIFVRLAYRSIYVVLTTTIAAAIPFFSSFVGLIGAISYFPTSVLFPIM